MHPVFAAFWRGVLQKDSLHTKTAGLWDARMRVIEQTTLKYEVQVQRVIMCQKYHVAFDAPPETFVRKTDASGGCDSTPEPVYPDAHSPECMQCGCGAPHSSHATRSLVRLAAFRWQPRSPHHTEIGTVDCSSEQCPNSWLAGRSSAGQWFEPQRLRPSKAHRSLFVFFFSQNELF